MTDFELLEVKQIKPNLYYIKFLSTHRKGLCAIYGNFESIPSDVLALFPDLDELQERVIYADMITIQNLGLENEVQNKFNEYLPVSD